MILVDTNILVDVASANEQWSKWSMTRLAAARSGGRIAINAVIYAEFAMGFASHAECEREITQFELDLLQIPGEALYAAGRAFIRYRQLGGSRTGVLPDFFIGAHAQALGLPILTRDAGRYRTYFPDVRLILPDGQ